MLTSAALSIIRPSYVTRLLAVYGGHCMAEFPTVRAGQRSARDRDHHLPTKQEEMVDFHTEIMYLYLSDGSG